MTKGSWWVVALVVCSAFADPAAARAAEFGVGIRGGTQGAGAEVAVGVTDWFSIRGGLYGLSVSDTYEEGGIDYDGTLKVGGAGVLADFFPLRGKFRVTAGLFSNENEIELVATPTQPQEIGGTIYDPSAIGTLNGIIAFDDTAPYLGVGWGNLAKGKRVGFLFDLGILSQDSGRVSLNASEPLVSDEDLAAEAAEIENDISDYDLWPVISVGIAIRF